MKIGLAQINPTIGDFEHNTEKIKAYAQRARDLGCDLVVFSELAVCGYPPRDLLRNKGFVETSLDYQHRLVESLKGIGVICGFVHKHPHQDKDDSLHDSAVLFEGGKILHAVHKKDFCGHESMYFDPGSPTAAFDYKGTKVGLTICEEVFHKKKVFAEGKRPHDPLGSVIEQGADLIINIAASPYHVGKRGLRWETLSHVAKTHGVAVVHVNQVGGNDSLIFDGVSTAFDSKGRMAACAREFEEDVIVFDTGTQKGDMRDVSQNDIESLSKALVMGTRDYAHKCGFAKAVVGLSGGIDSAVTASIAVRALGAENVLGAFMPSQHTSEHSAEDAKALANNLDIELVQIPIEPICDQAFQSLSHAFGQAGPDDLTQQNIQARVRAVLLMALSNNLGHLVLATGNQSELAVGYCTLYGDMSGGLAVISDVPKTQVYELARAINGQEEVIPRRILEKAPSAELKTGQVDQDDLPPYDVLDGILKAYIEENKTPEQIHDMGFDAATVRQTIKRVRNSQYKRRQAPPGLRVAGSESTYPIACKF